MNRGLLDDWLVIGWLFGKTINKEIHSGEGIEAERKYTVWGVLGDVPMDFPIDMLLLLLSYLILLFQILNRSHYFEKKNIHSIILIRLCSKGKLLFVLGSLLWSISIICTTDWTISHWIGFGLVVMCYIVEYNFYGIPLEPINYPKFIDVGQGQVIREEIVEYIVDQPVIGIILEEETRAYSTESLARCHVVNDECGRYKYAVCWCVFSQFGMVSNNL